MPSLVFHVSPELEDPFVRRFLREEVVAAVPTVPAPTVPALTATAPTVPAFASSSDPNASLRTAHGRSRQHGGLGRRLGAHQELKEPCLLEGHNARRRLGHRRSCRRGLGTRVGVSIALTFACGHGFAHCLALCSGSSSSTSDGLRQRNQPARGRPAAYR